MSDQHSPPTTVRTREEWQRTLRSSRIRPSRSMGQNFLVEPAVVEAIVAAAEVQAGDRVVEIGSGMGILSRHLLAHGAQVVGVELDHELAELLREQLGIAEGFTLMERDARYVEILEITEGEPYQVVANLPYSIATVVIRHFVESENPPYRLTVMVQREVAERMTALPPEMSLLGLATQFYSDASIAFIVPPEVFVPPPKVESAVVRMDIRRDLPLDPTQSARMFELATMAFQRKRKTLANGLSQGLGDERAVAEARIREAGVDAGLRPQALSVDDWILLAKGLGA